MNPFAPLFSPLAFHLFLVFCSFRNILCDENALYLYVEGSYELKFFAFIKTAEYAAVARTASVHVMRFLFREDLQREMRIDRSLRRVNL